MDWMVPPILETREIEKERRMLDALDLSEFGFPFYLESYSASYDLVVDICRGHFRSSCGG